LATPVFLLIPVGPSALPEKIGFIQKCLRLSFIDFKINTETETCKAIRSIPGFLLRFGPLPVSGL